MSTEQPKAGIEWREEWVPRASIAKVEALQVRKRLDPAAVHRYAELTRAGQVLPPIKLARVATAAGPVLYLVDGWHRMEAGALQVMREGFEQDTPGEQVLALVADMSEADARWEAAQANMAHGVPLKAAELRQVFRAFIKAGKHRRGRAGLLSYEDIGKAIGKPKSTIYRWMQADFPKTAKRMSSDGMGNPDAGLNTPEAGPNLGQQVASEALKAIQQAAIAATAMDPAQRHEVADALRQALAVVEQLGTVPPEF